jgi:hypothetical protein
MQISRCNSNFGQNTDTIIVSQQFKGILGFVFVYGIGKKAKLKIFGFC